MRPLVLGTRGSALARRQAELAVEALLRVGPDVEIETRVIRTEGDRRRDVPLEEIGGEGVFVKDIERRLAKGEIDLAVHSLKDMPAQTPEGLEIGAVLARGGRIRRCRAGSRGPRASRAAPAGEPAVLGRRAATSGRPGRPGRRVPRRRPRREAARR